MSSSKAEHKIEYLKPSQLFRETMKRSRHSPSASFIALSFSDGFASLAISDEAYLCAFLHGIYPIDKTFSFDKLVDDVQGLLELYIHELEGIIVTVHDSVASLVNIQNLMYDICKKLDLESLKYTCWKNDIAPQGERYECNKFGSLFWGMTFPGDYSAMQERAEKISAGDVLQAFLNVFNTLYRERTWRIKVGYKDEEWEDSERKKQLKTIQQRSSSEHPQTFVPR